MKLYLSPTDLVKQHQLLPTHCCWPASPVMAETEREDSRRVLAWMATHQQHLDNQVGQGKAPTLGLPLGAFPRSWRLPGPDLLRLSTSPPTPTQGLSLQKPLQANQSTSQTTTDRSIFLHSFSSDCEPY